jgi:DNA-binding GntR family transcriptional regulator
MRIRSELSQRLTNLRLVPTDGQELSEGVVRTLRPAILSGGLPRGMRLIEEEIAAKLGVSRGPVREALAILQQESLVTVQPRRGATVVGVTERDIRELYGLRLLLETHAAELAAANARPEDIDYLAGLSDRLAERARGARLDTLSPVDIVFHRHLFVMANQRRLRTAWEHLAGILEALLTITDSSRPHDVRHHYIVQALREQDPHMARDAMRVHLERAQAIMVDVLRRTQRQRAERGERDGRDDGEDQEDGTRRVAGVAGDDRRAPGLVNKTLARRLPLRKS